MTHERQIAREIRDEYIETMSKIYYSYFKGYLTKLTKLQVLCCMLCGLLLMLFLRQTTCHVVTVDKQRSKWTKLFDIRQPTVTAKHDKQT